MIQTADILTSIRDILHADLTEQVRAVEEYNQGGRRRTRLLIGDGATRVGGNFGVVGNGIREYYKQRAFVDQYATFQLFAEWYRHDLAVVSFPEKIWDSAWQKGRWLTRLILELENAHGGYPHLTIRHLLETNAQLRVAMFIDGAGFQNSYSDQLASVVDEWASSVGRPAPELGVMVLPSTWGSLQVSLYRLKKELTPL